MTNQPGYLLEVGEADQERLEILNEIYNPTALEFLKASGLKSGMHALEVGCGIGEMACALAEIVGPTGKITATDISADQLAIANEKASQRNLANIEFKQIAAENISQLNTKFDVVYERWTLIFVKQPYIALQAMYDVLKPGGILCCEDLNANNLALFASPAAEVVDFFNHYISNIFDKFNLEPNFSNQLYQKFIDLGCKSAAVKVKIHQPALTTPREKAVIRLGLISSKNSAIKTDPKLTEILAAMISKANTFEQQSGMLGFIRNILISGKK